MLRRTVQDVADDTWCFYELIVQGLQQGSYNNPYLQVPTVQLLDMITSFNQTMAATGLAFDHSAVAEPPEILSVSLFAYAIMLSVMKDDEHDACARSLLRHASMWATNKVIDQLQRLACIDIFQRLWCIEPGLITSYPHISTSGGKLNTNNEESQAGRSFLALISQTFYHGTKPYLQLYL